MNDSRIILRDVRPSDAAALCAIYEPFVRETTISFEDIVPDEAEFRSRIDEIYPHYPYIVCEIDKTVVGYAYGHSYRARAAYRWGAELSVYVKRGCGAKLVGTAMYKALIELLRLMNYQTVYGIVTSPNPKSDRMHLRLGFRNAGVMKNTGYKLGQWCDITNYELAIGNNPAVPDEPLRFDALGRASVDEILSRFVSEIIL